MDDQQLAEIKALAALAYSPEQVAQVLGLNANAFTEHTQDEDSAIGRAYWAGWYETDIPLRKSVFDLAKRGSSPAQTLALKLVQESEGRRFYGR